MKQAPADKVPAESMSPCLRRASCGPAACCLGVGGEGKVNIAGRSFAQRALARLRCPANQNRVGMPHGHATRTTHSASPLNRIKEMYKILGLTRHSGSTRAHVLEGQGRSQPQTPAHPNAQLPQTAHSGPNHGASSVRTSPFRGVMRSTNLPASLMPRSRGQASAPQDSFGSTATEPLLSPQSGALLNSDEETQALAARPRTYKKYCQQWDAWKNEAHPSNENRADAVKRMKRWLTLAIAMEAVAPNMPVPGAQGPVFLFPRANSFSTLDLSSLGLSSLPPWLPPARKVNLDNNRLTSVPINLITNPVYRRQSQIDVQSKIQLTNNPLPDSEINSLQSIADSSGYQGPKLVFSRPDTVTSSQGYEAD